MKHFAANYIFDGKNFIKNSCLSFDENGFLLSVGDINSGLEERERMIFLNGIICPYFKCKSFTKEISLKEFLSQQNISFLRSTTLPIILLENIDLQNLEFTENTFVTEIH